MQSEQVKYRNGDRPVSEVNYSKEDPVFFALKEVTRSDCL